MHRRFATDLETGRSTGPAGIAAAAKKEPRIDRYASFRAIAVRNTVLLRQEGPLISPGLAQVRCASLVGPA